MESLGRLSFLLKAFELPLLDANLRSCVEGLRMGMVRGMVECLEDLLECLDEEEQVFPSPMSCLFNDRSIEPAIEIRLKLVLLCTLEEVEVDAILESNEGVPREGLISQ